jgi:chromosome segregation ATPase
VVVPDIDTALRLFPLRGWTLVTLQGDVLTGDGMLHAGTDGASATASVLERRNQVAALEVELVELSAQVDERQKRREALTVELEGLGLQLSQAREQKHASG